MYHLLLTLSMLPQLAEMLLGSAAHSRSLSGPKKEDYKYNMIWICFQEKLEGSCRGLVLTEAGGTEGVKKQKEAW